MKVCVISVSGVSRILSALLLIFVWSANAAGSEASWRPVGISGGGGLFAPAISAVDPNLMMVNCDMSAAYISEDGGHSWRMINQAELRSDTACRPAFHPKDANVILASSSGRLKISRDRGKTFSPLGDMQESLFGEIAINPVAPDKMLAGSRDGRIWKSEDGGKAWKTCMGPTGRLLGIRFDRSKNGETVIAGTEKGIWLSDDGGAVWQLKTKGLPWSEIQGFASGSNRDGNTVMLYCSIRSKVINEAFGGGIYRSRDRGETWEPVVGQGLNREVTKADEWAFGSISQYVQLLAADANPMTVYAFNTSTGFHPPHSDTVYRSDDGGDTWRATYFEDPRFKNYNVTPDWETASCGQSFKGGEAPFGVAISDSDPDRVMLVRNAPIITHDGGRTWFGGHSVPAPGQKPGVGSTWLCNGLVITTTWHFYVDPFEANRQYICYTDIGMARSMDSGRSWSWWDPKSWAPWRNTCFEMAFDPEVPGKIWGAFSDVHDIPNDNIIGGWHSDRGPGGVCVSRDFGGSWKNETTDLPKKPVTSVVVDPRSPKNKRTLYATSFDDGVYKSMDDGKSWVVKKSGLGDPRNMRVYRVILHRDGTLFATICGKRSASNRVLMEEGVGVYRSTDGAETWQKISASAPLRYTKDLSVDPADSRRLLLGAADAGGGDESGGLYLTENGGASWRRIGREGPQTFGGYFHPHRTGWIYMTLTEGAPGAGLWLSRDNGGTWQPFKELPFANIQRVEFDPKDDETIRVTTFGGSVWIGPAVPGSL